MTVCLFVLGLPGSGKSTVYRHIENYVKHQYHKPVTRINDYDILYKMYLEDKEERFIKIEHDGFDIRDFSVLDAALNKMGQDARNYIECLQERQLVVIEFARNDYGQALKHFSQAILKDAYFLFLDVDIVTCQERVRNRVIHRKTGDDHYVSDNIFKSYYNEDSKHYISSRLKHDYELEDRRIKIIDNRGSEMDFVDPVNQLVDLVLKIV